MARLIFLIAAQRTLSHFCNVINRVIGAIFTQMMSLQIAKLFKTAFAFSLAIRSELKQNGSGSSRKQIEA